MPELSAGPVLAAIPRLTGRDGAWTIDVIRPLDTHTAHVAAWARHRGMGMSADRGQAQAFLDALDPMAEFFFFRSFSETHYTRCKGRDPLEHDLRGSLVECWDRLVELNRSGAAVTVTVNASSRQGRRVEDVLRVRALFVDDDRPDVREGPFALAPHIRVRSSPGRYHHYWLVEGCPLDEFQGFQRELASALGTDHRVASLNQAMALPGFWRRKRMISPVQTLLLEARQMPAYDCRTLVGSLLHGAS